VTEEKSQTASIALPVTKQSLIVTYRAGQREPGLLSRRIRRNLRLTFAGAGDVYDYRVMMGHNS